MVRSALLLTMLSACFAQDDPHYELGPRKIETSFTIGGIRQDVISDGGYKTTVGGGVSYGFSEKLAVSFRITGGPYNNHGTVDALPWTAHSTLLATWGELRYSFERPRHRLTPYVTGGAGGMTFRNITTAIPASVTGVITSDLHLTTGWQAIYTLGGGLNIGLNHNAGITLGITGIKGQNTGWFYAPTAGIYLRLQ